MDWQRKHTRHDGTPDSRVLRSLGYSLDNAYTIPVELSLSFTAQSFNAVDFPTAYIAGAHNISAILTAALRSLNIPGHEYHVNLNIKRDQDRWPYIGAAFYQGYVGQTKTIFVEGNSTLAPCLKNISIYLLLISEQQIAQLLQEDDLFAWRTPLRTEISEECAKLYK